MLKTFASLAGFIIFGCLHISAMGQGPPDPWSRFRGPNGSGIDRTHVLPSDWAKQDLKWQFDLAGSGHSSPIVWQNRVFVTSYSDNGQLVLQAIDLTSGTEQWVWSTPVKPHPMHRLNNVAASTPTTDGKRVYLLIPEADNLHVVAIDLEGKKIWQRDLGPWVAQHGFGMSPIVIDEKLIVMNSQEPFQNLPEPGASEVIALESESGKDLWRTKIDGGRACYGAPLILSRDQQTMLAGATVGEGLFAMNLDNGEFLWKQPALTQRVVGAPILSAGHLLANNGSGGGGNYLVSLDVSTNEPKSNYELRRSIGYVPTLIAVNDLLFSFTDNGLLACFDLQSGTEHFVERIASGFWSSPVSDGQNLFCIDKDGVLYSIAADKKFKLLSKHDFHEPTEATPAIADGHLIVRTLTHLFCY